MKKRYVILLALLVATSMMACSLEETGKGNESNKVENATNENQASMPLQSPEELTLEKVMELMNVTNMVKCFGPFHYISTMTSGTASWTWTREGIYTINDDGEIEKNTIIIDRYGMKLIYYINSDENDPYYYISDNYGSMRSKKDEYVMRFEKVFFADDDDTYANEYKVISTKEEDGLYVVEIQGYFYDTLRETFELSFAPETGCIRSCKKVIHDENHQRAEYEFVFDKSIQVDRSPKEECETSLDKKEAGTLVFDTVDINGDPITSDIIKGSKVVLMNHWVLWSEPNIEEISKLQRLYENYKDRGLLILGVYSDSENPKEIVEDAGVTYPVLHVDSNLYAYEENSVSVTYIFDGDGKLLEQDPIQGSKSYEDWEKIVLEYLPE